MRLQIQDPSKASPMSFPILVWLLLMLVTLPLGTAASAVRYYKAVDNISYAVKKDTGVVCQAYGMKSYMEIADIYKGVQVTVIEKRAFASRSALEKIDLPEKLEKIGRGAFSNCKSLQELVLPGSVMSIESGAFKNCKSLERITIPPSVTEIPKNAFKGCPKNMVIVGKPGSVAQVFAEKYFTFEAIAP